MEAWKTRIRCYVSPAGNNRIEDWYRGLSPPEKADADEFLKTIRKTREWKMPDYKPRIAGGGGLGELRWVSEGKQQRLLGFFGRDCWYAVLGCTHKQNVYKPSDAIETAKRNKAQIERGEVDTVEYDL